MPHWKCAHKHMEGLHLMLWSRSGATQKWGKAPWAVMLFFCGSFQPVLRSLCSPDRYLALLYHNPPLHLNVNTNVCKCDCSLVSSGLVSFYKCQKSSPPFHEQNRKHWTALLPNKIVRLSSGKYCLADALFQTCIQHPLKGASGWNEGIVLSWALFNHFAHLPSLQHTIYNCLAADYTFVSVSLTLKQFVTFCVCVYVLIFGSRD